jgi:hypothetical protein
LTEAKELKPVQNLLSRRWGLTKRKSNPVSTASAFELGTSVAGEDDTTRALGELLDVTVIRAPGRDAAFEVHRALRLVFQRFLDAVLELLVTLRRREMLPFADILRGAVVVHLAEPIVEIRVCTMEPLLARHVLANIHGVYALDAKLKNETVTGAAIELVPGKAKVLVQQDFAGHTNRYDE